MINARGASRTERQVDGVVLRGRVVPAGDDLPASGAPLEYLTAEAAALIYDGVAENTRTAYRRAWTQFESWCEQYGFTPMPCGELTLANYVAHLVVADLAPATIDQAIACILSRHELARQPKPNTKAARHALRGYKRRLLDDGWRQRKAPPILLEQLQAVVAALPRTVAGMRDQFILVVGWWMMARRSELVALNDVDLRFVKEGLEVYVAAPGPTRRRAARCARCRTGSGPTPARFGSLSSGSMCSLRAAPGPRSSAASTAMATAVTG